MIGARRLKPRLGTLGRENPRVDKSVSIPSLTHRPINLLGWPARDQGG